MTDLICQAQKAHLIEFHHVLTHLAIPDAVSVLVHLPPCCNLQHVHGIINTPQGIPPCCLQSQPHSHSVFWCLGMAVTLTHISNIPSLSPCHQLIQPSGAFINPACLLIPPLDFWKMLLLAEPLSQPGDDDLHSCKHYHCAYGFKPYQTPLAFEMTYHPPIITVILWLFFSFIFNAECFIYCAFHIFVKIARFLKNATWPLCLNKQKSTAWFSIDNTYHRLSLLSMRGNSLLSSFIIILPSSSIHPHPRCHSIHNVLNNKPSPLISGAGPSHCIYSN